MQLDWRRFLHGSRIARAPSADNDDALVKPSLGRRRCLAAVCGWWGRGMAPKSRGDQPKPHNAALCRKPSPCSAAPPAIAKHGKWATVSTGEGAACICRPGRSPHGMKHGTTEFPAERPCLVSETVRTRIGQQCYRLVKTNSHSRGTVQYSSIRELRAHNQQSTTPDHDLLLRAAIDKASTTAANHSQPSSTAQPTPWPSSI